MRQKHSRLSLCVTLMILLGWCVCPQLRAYHVEVGGIYYNLSGTSATVTYPTESAPTAAGTNPYTESIVIPSTITVGSTTYTVTTIGESAFFYSTITSVELPSTVTEIQKAAFARTKLSTVTIPNSVVYLRNDAFAYNLNMKTAYVGTGVTTLDQGVFFSTPLTDVYFYGDTPPSKVFTSYVFSKEPTLHCHDISLEKYQASGLATYMSEIKPDCNYRFIELQALIGNLNKVDIKIGTNPGYATQTTTEAYISAFTTAKSVTTNADSETIKEAYINLLNRYNELELIPVTEGYYVLFCDNDKIAANGKSPKAMYINTKNNKVYWGEYEENNLKFIFKISPNGDKWNIQNVENKLYVNGATKYCASFDASATCTSKTYFKYYLGTGSMVIKNVLDSESDQTLWTMCPQGNPSGTSDGPNTIFAYNGDGLGGGNVPYAEWNWRLTPISEETVNNIILTNDLRTLLASMETLTASDDPNKYSATEVAKCNAVIAQARQAVESGTIEEKKAAYEALSQIKSQLVPNPITEGYYYITSAGNGPGNSGGSHNYEDKNAMYNNDGIVKWKAYNQNDKTQIYYLLNGADGWYAYNFADNSYINVPKASYGCDVTTSAEATTTQKFVTMVEGTGKFAIYSTKYAYALAGNHNGTSNTSGKLNVWGSPSEAKTYGVNQWFLHKVPASISAQYDDAIVLVKFKKTIAEYKAAASTYKTSLQDGDYYASTDDKHGLHSHYFVDGTEKTSQKGYECTQSQIDALNAAISEAETLLNDEGASIEDITTAMNKAAAAKTVCDKKWDPVTDGVYFIINGFADDAPTAAQALKYGEDGEVLYKRPLIVTEPKQMFEVKVLTWATDGDGDKIPTSAYIKNVASGKYLGGVSNGQNVFSDTPVAITWPEVNTQGSTKQAHRFQFQTPTGEQFYGQNNSAGCEVKTSGGYQWHRSWMFRPADKYYQEYITNKEYNDFKNLVLRALNTPTARQDGDLGSNSWIDGTERTAVAGVETTQESLDALRSAWNTYDADRTAENKTAVETAMARVNKKWEPLTDGIYFLIPRYGDDQENKNTLAMTNNESDAAWKKPLSKYNLNFMHEVKIKTTTADAELGEVPATFTIKNLGSGKYLGKINGSAWEYQDEEVVWSYTTFVGDDFFSPTKHAHCFGLNINGKFITYVKNTAGSALTTTTGGNAWFRAWMFRPADECYNMIINNPNAKTTLECLENAKKLLDTSITPADHHDNNGTRSFLLGDEIISVPGLSTTKTALANLQTAYDALKAAFNADPTKYYDDLMNDVKIAMAKVSDPNRLTDGYYHLIAEYGDDTNNVPGGWAIESGALAEKPEAPSKQHYDAKNISQMFYAEYDEENNKIALRNVASGLYLGKVNGNVWEFVAEKTYLNIESGNDYFWARQSSETKAARSCSFILTDDNKTGIRSTVGNTQLGTVTNVTASTWAWTISWAFRPVATELIPTTTVVDNTAKIDFVGEINADKYKIAAAQIADKKVSNIDLSDLDLGTLTPENLKIDGVSANAVYYLPTGYSQDADNFVIDGNCKNLVLTDKAEFAPGTSFTATNATYQKYGLDGSGWYSVVLPYDVTVPSGMKVLNNAVVSESTIKFDAVAEGATISANTPFLYKTADNSVAFSATGATINATAGTSGDLKGTYTLIAAGDATGKLILNSDGSAFARATALASIPAFRAYIDGTGLSGSNTFSIVIDDELTGVADAATLNGQGSLVDVYTTDGTLVRSQVDPLTALQGLPKGTYIVNGKTYKK